MINIVIHQHKHKFVCTSIVQSESSVLHDYNNEVFAKIELKPDFLHNFKVVSYLWGL